MNGKHLEDLVTRMQKELNLLYTWLQANKLALNRQKTYYIIFHRARIKLTCHTSDLNIGDSILLMIYNMDSTNHKIGFYGYRHNVQSKTLSQEKCPR